MALQEVPFSWKEPYDEQLKAFITKRRFKMRKVGQECKVDSFFWIVGNNGTGKSNLMLHIVDLYFNGQKAYVEGVAMNEDSYKNAVRIAKERFMQSNEENDLPRFTAYDEADASKRNPHNKFIKNTLRMLWKSRVCGFLNIWCWPSLSWIDKHIVARAHGVFLCISTEENKPRRYIFFSRKAINDIIEKENVELSCANLRRLAQKYGSWAGRFRKYEGTLADAYMNQKIDGTLQEIDEYVSGQVSEPAQVNNGVVSALPVQAQVQHTAKPSVVGVYNPDPEDLIGSSIAGRLLNMTAGKVTNALLKMHREGVYPTLTTNGYRIKAKDIHLILEHVKHKNSIMTLPFSHASPFYKRAMEENFEKKPDGKA